MDLRPSVESRCLTARPREKCRSELIVLLIDLSGRSPDLFIEIQSRDKPMPRDVWDVLSRLETYLKRKNRSDINGKS